MATPTRTANIKPNSMSEKERAVRRRDTPHSLSLALTPFLQIFYPPTKRFSSNCSMISQMGSEQLAVSMRYNYGLQLIEHVSTCKDPRCCIKNCGTMKGHLQEITTKGCKKEMTGQLCLKCQKTKTLIRLHSNQCTHNGDTPCPVPFCSRLRNSLKLTILATREPTTNQFVHRIKRERLSTHGLSTQDDMVYQPKKKAMLQKTEAFTPKFSSSLKNLITESAAAARIAAQAAQAQKQATAEPAPTRKKPCRVL